MKKILLLAAAAATGFAVQAASFNDYLTVTIGEAEVTEGAVINVDEYEDLESIVPGMGYKYIAHIVLENKTSNSLKNKIAVSYTDHPSQAMEKADPKAWGTLQLCFNGMEEGDSCLTGIEGELTVPAGKVATYDFDNNGVDPEKAIPNRKYQIAITAGGETLTFFVNFQYKDESGVSDILASDSEAEFFNLQGQRVANPGQGFYLVKKAGKTSKVMLR